MDKIIEEMREEQLKATLDMVVKAFDYVCEYIAYNCDEDENVRCANCKYNKLCNVLLNSNDVIGVKGFIIGEIK